MKKKKTKTKKKQQQKTVLWEIYDYLNSDTVHWKIKIFSKCGGIFYLKNRIMADIYIRTPTAEKVENA